MGRCLRITLPQVDDRLQPQWQYLRKFKTLNKKFKQKQKIAFNCRHRVRPLPLIPDNTDVWISLGQTAIPGQVNCSADTPRSYIVNTPGGQIMRNHRHLNVIPNNTNTSVPDNTSDNSRHITRSMTGATVCQPDRLRF